jgi:peptidoglycan/xylan/chitin deacetylase (PgdA/CDA1 family)
MTVRSMFGRMRQQVLCSLHRRTVDLGTRGPIVSFCFDDFPRTAYTTGGSLLEAFGGRGTYYVAISLMNTSSKLGELLRTEDLHSLVENGHELGNQSYSHVSCRKVPLLAFRHDVRREQEAIREMRLVPSSNFAYPYGEVTIAAKKAIGQDMSSCRSIYRGVNGPQLDLNLLRANSLYGDIDRLQEVEQLVAENDERKGWLIFYTHDVRENPSEFGCTPRLLESTISRAVRQGARIQTVAQVLAELESRNETHKDIVFA